MPVMIYTMDEVKQIIAEYATNSLKGAVAGEVRFIHRYSDGSGETDIEDLGSVHRVEVDV